MIAGGPPLPRRHFEIAVARPGRHPRTRGLRRPGVENHPPGLPEGRCRRARRARPLPSPPRPPGAPPRLSCPPRPSGWPALWCARRPSFQPRTRAAPMLVCAPGRKVNRTTGRLAVLPVGQPADLQRIQPSERRSIPRFRSTACLMSAVCRARSMAKARRARIRSRRHRAVSVSMVGRTSSASSGLRSGRAACAARSWRSTWWLPQSARTNEETSRQLSGAITMASTSQGHRRWARWEAHGRVPQQALFSTPA